MKHSQVENARVKEKIVDGFFMQLEHQPFSEIRVSQLIKSAEVARVSYYRNFDSIEDILDFYLTCFIIKQHKKEHEKNPNHEITENTSWNRIRDSFIAFKMEAERFTLLINRGLSSHIYEFYIQLAEEIKAKHMPNFKPEYKHVFVYGATFHVLMTWLVNGTEESPEEMADFLIKSLPVDFLPHSSQPD
ncbi:TetR-like C-terminal domain-containing protein [Fructobacillus ficulneus]|uniref:Transcriptional regulator, TetR family n=1 Tax=Fructobacillus ficulneus TaxID=157463 RepID=A0A0K8MFN3_9LACO|nr:TetR-like C-terminal domain-containing protein [Fructobacillus ficulneus]GAO99320.1 transcriptional regulator, TetR family [Fructobacillus ficulneus]